MGLGPLVHRQSASCEQDYLAWALSPWALPAFFNVKPSRSLAGTQFMLAGPSDVRAEAFACIAFEVVVRKSPHV